VIKEYIYIYIYILDEPGTHGPDGDTVRKIYARGGCIEEYYPIVGTPDVYANHEGPVHTASVVPFFPSTSTRLPIS
jgi:hypothetical protein